MRIDHVADSNRRLFNKKKNDRLYSIVSVCVSVMRNPHTHTHTQVVVLLCVCLFVARVAAAAADELFNLIEGKLFFPIRCKLEFWIDADGMYCVWLYQHLFILFYLKSSTLLFSYSFTCAVVI